MLNKNILKSVLISIFFSSCGNVKTSKFISEKVKGRGKEQTSVGETSTSSDKEPTDIQKKPQSMRDVKAFRLFAGKRIPRRRPMIVIPKITKCPERRISLRDFPRHEIDPDTKKLIESIGSQ